MPLNALFTLIDCMKIVCIQFLYSFPFLIISSVLQKQSVLCLISVELFSWVESKGEFVHYLIGKLASYI